MTVDALASEVARLGMRLDRFMALGAEGLLPNEELRHLWRKYHDLVLPYWAA